ncbi:MAG: hypothetical protein MUP44_02350 [Anaerolineales bacterium]|nr:hypothetical protein [Anaerolineales bacterium]
MAPSAGRRYLPDLYMITAEGVAQYLPEGYKIEVMLSEDLREALSRAALFQDWI